MQKLIAVGTALAMFATATPAFAAVNSTHITLTVTNRGTINNLTGADAHSGQNLALGSQGGDGGLGGSITAGTSTGSENNGGALAGNGGNGGNGGAGGFVQTGNASADAATSNDLNNTDAAVELDCDCGDINSVTIDGTIDNNDANNVINNLTGARGRSGQNLALGSQGGDAGDGGLVDSGAGSENNGGAKAGTGGSGGAGGLGGEIHTGNATATAGTINMLNTVMLRVRL